MTKETEFLETLITLVWNDISKQELVEMLKDRKQALEQQLLIPVVGSSLPSKERVTDQANSYAENFNKTEINLIKKQAFEAGVNWLLLCYCNEVR